MTEEIDAMVFYDKQLSESKTLGIPYLIIGFILSTLLMVASTWGLLFLLSAFEFFQIDETKIGPYTNLMLLGSLAATVVAAIISLVIIKHPKSVSLPLKLHSFFKRKTGEYFLCPEVTDQSMGLVFRRSFYGSLLVVGIALTAISFDMLVVVETFQVLTFGFWVMVVSVAILPFIVMQFYYGPWLIKDAGLFHLDLRDRSLSNVGDDLEDILEFFAGIDLFLVWLDLTITYGFHVPWLPVFVILVSLGPLFAIVLNFTFVFMLIKRKATTSVIEYMLKEIKVPDMVDSSDYIRRKVLALVDRRMLVEEAIEGFEQKMGESVRGPDLMGAMIEGLEEIETKRPSELPKQEPGEASIRLLRESLEQGLETTSDMGVTSLAEKEGTEDQSENSEKDANADI